MKGCVQWKPVYGWEYFASSGLELATARSVGQHLTHWATGAPPNVNIAKVYGYTAKGKTDLEVFVSLITGNWLKENIYSQHLVSL